MDAECICRCANQPKIQTVDAFMSHRADVTSVSCAAVTRQHGSAPADPLYPDLLPRSSASLTALFLNNLSFDAPFALRALHSCVSLDTRSKQEWTCRMHCVVAYTHLGYAAKVGDSASEKESLDGADISDCFMESWSVLLMMLDIDALHMAMPSESWHVPI